MVAGVFISARDVLESMDEVNCPQAGIWPGPGLGNFGLGQAGNLSLRWGSPLVARREQIIWWFLCSALASFGALFVG